MDETPRDPSAAFDTSAAGVPHGTLGPHPAPSVPAGAAPDAAAADVRVSDADRDRVADILREALAQGRLDPQEHAERIDRTYRAKTAGELRSLIRDLPEGRPVVPAPQPPPPPPSYGAPGDTLTAVCSTVARRGRWRVGYRTRAFALLGTIEIDLTEALFEHRQVEINVTAILGNVEIRVPENVTLRGTGSGVLGSCEVRTAEAADPNAPVVLVSGFALLGSVEAKPRRGALLWDLRGRPRRRPDGHQGPVS